VTCPIGFNVRERALDIIRLVGADPIAGGHGAIS